MPIPDILNLPATQRLITSIEEATAALVAFARAIEKAQASFDEWKKACDQLPQDGFEEEEEEP